MMAELDVALVIIVVILCIILGIGVISCALNNQCTCENIFVVYYRLIGCIHKLCDPYYCCCCCVECCRKYCDNTACCRGYCRCNCKHYTCVMCGCFPTIGDNDYCCKWVGHNQQVVEL